MADKKFKKLQVGPAVSYVDAKLGIKIDDQEIGGSGKIWHELDLTAAEATAIEKEGQAVIELDQPYVPTDFANDYLQVNIKIVGEYIGNLVKNLEPLNKLYVDFVHTDDWCNSSVQNAFYEITDPKGKGIVESNYRIGYIYSQTNAETQSYFKLNSNYVHEGKSGPVGAGFSRADSATGSWSSGTSCPIVEEQIEKEFKDGDIWTGYGEGKSFIIAYKLGDTYYWAEATKEATSPATVKVYGDNPEQRGDSGVEDVYKFYPNYKSENSLNGYNMVYIADVTAQPWDKMTSNADEAIAEAVAVNELKEFIKVEEDKLEESEYGKQFAINIHGKDTKVSYLMVFEDSRMSKLDASHKVTEWADTDAGKVYHLTWDATAKRYSLGAELTAAEMQTLFSTGVVFDSKSGAEVVITDNETADIYWECPCVASDYYALQYVFSCDKPFVEPTSESSSTFIGRPLGMMLKTSRYENPKTGKFEEETSGQYVWTADIGEGTITAAIPVARPNVLLIQAGDSDGSSNLYRHTFHVYSSSLALVPCNVSFLAVNGQSGKSSNSIIEYLLWSDTKEGWILPATGYVKVGDNWRPVIEVGTEKVGDNWAFVAKYLDDSYATQTQAIYNASSKANYNATDTEAIIEL